MNPPNQSPGQHVPHNPHYPPPPGQHQQMHASNGMDPAMGQYYENYQPQPMPPNSQQMMHQHPQDGSGNAQYPLPPENNNNARNSAQRREIKRRTKTGCLTCRKRRIKCDEAHPVCRNCTKSKRDCLGYDPIFKPTAQPTIQPAPSAAPPLQSTIAPSPYPPPPPQVYAPPIPQQYPPPPPGYHMPPAEPQQDYTHAIDPALQSAGVSVAQAPAMAEGRLEAKSLKIEDVLNINPVETPAVQPTNNPANPEREDIRQLFLTLYAPQIDKFFESKWWTTKGLQYLVMNRELCDKYDNLIGRFHITAANDWKGNQVTQNLEAHIIWETMALVRQASAVKPEANGSSPDPQEDVHEAARKLDIFEALLTNQPLSLPENDPIKAVEDANNLLDQMRSRSVAFWKQMGIFLSLSEPEESGASTEEIDGCLMTIRNLLDSREHRDILYSVAISRHLGTRLHKLVEAGKLDVKSPINTNDEEEPRNKLKVAREFIGRETMRGTNQIVQRICGMAVRSWTT